MDFNFRDKVVLIIFLFLHFETFSLYANNQIPLSQNSNYYIYETSDGLVFIGSQDGLNIYNGRSNTIYRPLTHNLIGENIQSEFYEDKEGNIWFTTYEALNVYLKRKEDFQSFQFQDSNGAKIDSDYRLIGQFGDTLFVISGSRSVLFNSSTFEEEVTFNSYANNGRTFDVIADEDSFVLVYVAGDGIYVKEYISSWNLKDSIKVNFPSRGIQSIDDCTIVAGSETGELLVYNICINKTISKEKICNSVISKIKKIDEHTILITSGLDGVFYYDLETAKIKEYLLRPEELEGVSNQLLSHNVSDNHILWFGLEGLGLERKIMSKKRFNHRITEHTKGKPIMGIQEISHGFTFLSILHGGYIVLDENLSIIRSETLKNEETNNIRSYYFSKEFGLVFFIGSKLFQLKDDFSFRANDFSNVLASHSIDKMVSTGSNVLCLGSDEKFYFLKKSMSGFQLQPADSMFQKNNKKPTNISVTKNDFIFVSNNDEFISIWKWKDREFEKVDSLPLAGELKSCLKLKDELCYIATVKGLFKYDILKSKCDTILDEDKLLAQTIYGVIPHKNKLWLSTNSGIILYDIAKNRTFQFTQKDGVQGMEFNTNAFHQYKDGSILMGGMNGLNYFHPDSIVLSDYIAPIHFSSLLVNDEKYEGAQPNASSTYTFSYEQNTLYFSFHAIDHTGPLETKTKYRLIGKDNDWSPPTKSDGYARYSNLSPGDYTFSVLGTNADGVWNKEPRNIEITILPPWYATWWARSLGALLLGGIVYLTFRTYYKRQLREKDLELREKNLIISKQQALAEERTRIAAEMHDDLGGGLTTIRFLSQKVLSKSKDQSIKSSVSKIVKQSEVLVDNMSEIIWAMNAGFDTLQSLVSYTRRYANRYLEDYDMELRFEVKGSTRDIKLAGTKRRNIFLTIKEALHNAVKHSEASKMSIVFEAGKSLKIRMKDNGKGLQEANELGNGLKNMKHRIQSIDGSIEYENNNGLEIILDIPW